VVAELREAGWVEWREEHARYGRADVHGPEAGGRFTEFLARPPIGQQAGGDPCQSL